jgi:hypothetical protein
VAEPVFRGGVWWQQQDDGTWLRWNDGTSSWEPSMSPPPDDGSALPPPPPMPGTSMPGPYGRPAAGANVANYLVWSILTTLLCCLPAGVVAIVYSSQVSAKLAAGDYAGAVDSSNKARTWCIVGAAAGVLSWIVYLAVFANSSVTTFSS